ncbi:VC0807 family protein [Chitinivorax sp. PXF-14]|uniref:VC0807 family protein n=1 Tax=Chitinivorax sp. PXF-14 TaxID=3230488 RepID=UPI00346503FA
MTRGKLVLELLVNGLLPWGAYTLARQYTGEFNAIALSALPPLLWSLLELARHRRVDAISITVLLGIALSLLAVLFGGDERLLLLREAGVTGLMGLLALSSLLWPRPVLYYLARATAGREDATGAAEFEAYWQTSPSLRRLMTAMTAVWSAGMVAEAGLRTVLLWTLTTERFLAVSPFVQYGCYGTLWAWTVWYRRRALPEAAEGPAQAAPGQP